MLLASNLINVEMFTLILCRLESRFHPVPDQLFSYFFSVSLDSGHFCGYFWLFSLNHFFPTQPKLFLSLCCEMTLTKVVCLILHSSLRETKKIFADISHSSLQLSQKIRCYWSLCTLLSVDYANMPRLLTKLSLFFANFCSFWLEAFVTEKGEEMSLKKCVTKRL